MGFFSKRTADRKASPPPTNYRSSVVPPKDQDDDSPGSKDPVGEPTRKHHLESEPHGVAAVAPPPPPVFETQFACVLMDMMNRLQFINFPRAQFPEILNGVETTWPKGVQQVRELEEAMEIKLNGSPWGRDYYGNDMARRFVRQLLVFMYNRGWMLQASVDMSKMEYDKDTLIFRLQSPAPPLCDWLAISFDRHNRLRFVDPPPQEVTDALLTTLGTAVHSHEAGDGFFEIKLHDHPWLPRGRKPNSVRPRVMILNMLATLERFGWSLYASVDQQNGSEGHEADVMYFHKGVDWFPGQPICHR